MNHLADSVEESVEASVEAIKPRLRGWLHAGWTPFVVVAGIVLICLAPTTQSRVCAAIYACTGLLLFATSATYHVGRWGNRVFAVLKRMDHANIYLIIAGSYTPMVMLALHGSTRTYLLVGVWVAATAGVLFRVVWTHAPRALYTGLYIALGWCIVPFSGDLFAANVPAAVLTFVGGLLYTLGGVVYGLKRPNPNPAWFGFHEVFHALTIAAWACHYIAISILTYTQ